VKHICQRLVHKFIFPSKKSERDKIVLNFADQFNSNNNAGFNLTNFKVQFINQFFQDVINDYEKSVIGTFTKELLDRLNTDENCKDRYQLYFTITKFENDIGFSLIHQEPEADSERDAFSENPEATGNEDLSREPMPEIMEGGANAHSKKESITLDDPADAVNSNLNINSQSFENQANAPGSAGNAGAKGNEVERVNRSPGASPMRARERHLRNQRKAMLTRHGVIPEYIRITEIYQVYTAFTQANLKNSILHQKQARKLAEISDDPVPPYKETELKEDVLVIQFKLVD
jgi:hypothetical protein